MEIYGVRFVFPTVLPKYIVKSVNEQNAASATKISVSYDAILIRTDGES